MRCVFITITNVRRFWWTRTSVITASCNNDRTSSLRWWTGVSSQADIIWNITTVSLKMMLFSEAKHCRYRLVKHYFYKLLRRIKWGHKILLRMPLLIPWKGSWTFSRPDSSARHKNMLLQLVRNSTLTQRRVNTRVFLPTFRCFNIRWNTPRVWYITSQCLNIDETLLLVFGIFLFRAGISDETLLLVFDI